jgi:ATP-dependent RNA helicase DDX55/SPB4
MLLVGGSDPAADVARFQEVRPSCAIVPRRGHGMTRRLFSILPRLQSGAHVLVGTPGRLDDIMTRCAVLSVRRLELLVLDEADRLLSMGFHAQVSGILSRLPKQRRTGLFSATQTEEVVELARAGLRNPVRITVRDAAGGAAGAGAVGPPGAGGKTPSQLALYYALVEADDKLPRLVAFLARHANEKARPIEPANVRV